MSSARARGADPAAASALDGVLADGARGAVSGLAARFLTHPMDTLKARAQVRGARGAVARAEGGRTRAVGLYKGFGAVAALAPLASGAYFVGYESGTRWFGTSASASAATGMWAQALAGVVYTPMDVIKERLQTQDVLGERARMGRYRHWVDAARVIAREEGARGLFRGYWAQNFVWWPWSAAYFAIYERSRVALESSGGEASPMVSAVSATAAIVFMGCTHIGTSHTIPPRRLNAPAKKSAGANRTEPCFASGKSSGMSVPRSPSEPDTSASVS